VNGPMKAAWGLTVFVIVAGVVLWALTGRAIFAAFIVLGVLTAVGAWFTTRSAATGGTTTSRPLDHPEEKP
jgi:dolichol kinase